MKQMYGYIRVSTAKQGDGVSLKEQKRAIITFAQKNDYDIIEWFEEKITAAKQGRPAFNRMLKQLRAKKAEGMIIHKIDRGARNLKDWAQIGDLIDAGFDVQFAHENIDLNSRGGRLTADLQAVISADYIRILRDEVKKGISGRLNDGFYPFAAPVGYLDTGKGKLKAVDATKAPLVKQMFDLYATGDYTLERLRVHMNSLGLTNIKGNPLCKNNISRMLNNPFYMGVIKIKKTGETFPGEHQPIISSVLFKKVKLRLHKKDVQKSFKHNPLFKNMIKCNLCHYVMSGEKQKGRYYYRCQQKECATKTIREDRMDDAFQTVLDQLDFDMNIKPHADKILHQEIKRMTVDHDNIEKTINAQEAQAKSKISGLTDLLMDGTIDKEIYIEKKETFTATITKLKERQTRLTQNANDLTRKAQDILELLFFPKLSYISASREEKRDYIRKLTSNFCAEGRNTVIELKKPFDALANLTLLPAGRPIRCSKRTFSDKQIEGIAKSIVEIVVTAYVENGDLDI